MTPSRWLGIGVGTLVWSIALWFGFLALATGPIIGLSIVGGGLVFTMYTVAGFSGANDPAQTGFRSSLVGLSVALVGLIVAEFTGLESVGVAVPVVAVGVGGAFALAPSGGLTQIAMRIIFVVAVAMVVSWVYGVDRTFYGVLAPLVTLPALGLADRAHDRAVSVVAE